MNSSKLRAGFLALGVLSSILMHAQNAQAQRAAIDKLAGPPAGQALTSAELAKVKAVLAPYKPASLTVEDAKLIKRTLRDAGLRKSRELYAALASFGFSAEKMDQLDPPPPRPSGEGAPPAREGVLAPQAKK